jgi:hypothetical protein
MWRRSFSEPSGEKCSTTRRQRWCRGGLGARRIGRVRRWRPGLTNPGRSIRGLCRREA